MIYGIVASEESFIIGAAPAGPTQVGSLDFVNGVYDWNGTSLAAGDVVDLTARISASGLEIIGGSPVQIIGAPLTTLLTGNWTAVIEFNFTNSSATPPGRRLFLLTVFDAGFNDQIAIYTLGSAPFANGEFFEDPGTGTTRVADGNSVVGTGISRIACTRTTDRISGSLAGETAVTNSTSINIASWTFTPSQVQTADGNQGAVHEGYIRTITVYNPVVDTDLPSLTI